MVRTQVPTTTTTTAAQREARAPATTPRGEPVGYAYDPVPKSVRYDRRLKAIDHVIVAILVSLAIWRRDSCWTTIRFIASQIPAIRPGRSGLAVVCEKTVQRSIKRLMDCGHIRREAVPIPDPDDPRNTTGYRYYFLCHVGRATQVRGETEGTTESGPSIVPQISIEVQELEEPVNVHGNGSARALEEDGEPASDHVTEPTATQTHHTVAAREVSPQPAELPPVPPVPSLPPVPSASDRERAAREVIRKCRDRGWQIGPDGSLEVLPVLHGKTEPPEDRHRAMLAAVLPEVLALKFPRTPTAAPGAPSQIKPAPLVPGETQAKARGLINQLPGNPDPASPTTVGRAIAEAFHDHKPESLATFLGIAADVRRGVLAIGCLLDAFEAGCSRTARNRGAVFIRAVKCSIRTARR
jgi:hypothetical protein